MGNKMDGGVQTTPEPERDGDAVGGMQDASVHRAGGNDLDAASAVLTLLPADSPSDTCRACGGDFYDCGGVRRCQVCDRERQQEREAG